MGVAVGVVVRMYVDFLIKIIPTLVYAFWQQH